MKNARILIAYILLTLVSSYAWAEKYEFVRLVGTNLETPVIELNAGDAALVVHYDSNRVQFWTDVLYYDITATPKPATTTVQISAIFQNRSILAGPAKLYCKHLYHDYVDGKVAGHVLPNYDTEKSSVTYIATIAISRASQTGSTTLAWNDNAWQGGDDGTQQANNNSSSPVPDPNGIRYDRLLGWCWFTDTPWIYSYTNGSWYYMRSSNEGIYVWNANLPNSGWMRLRG